MDCMATFVYSEIINCLKLLDAQPRILESAEYDGKQAISESRLRYYIDACLGAFESMSKIKGAAYQNIPTEYFTLLSELLNNLLESIRKSNEKNEFFNDNIFNDYDENSRYSIILNRIEIAQIIYSLYKVLYDAGILTISHKYTFSIEKKRLIDEMELDRDKLKQMLRHSEDELFSSQNKLKDDARKVFDEINDLKNNIDEKHNAITKLIDTVSTNSNASYYHRHAYDLQSKAIGWLMVALISLVVFIFTFYFAMSKNLVGDRDIWIVLAERSVYLFMSLLVLTYSGKQYSKERALSEQYKFKSLTLLSANLIKEIPHKDEIKDHVNLLILSQVLAKVDVDSASSKDSAEQQNTFGEVTKLVEVISKATKGG